MKKVKEEQEKKVHNPNINPKGTRATRVSKKEKVLVEGTIKGYVVGRDKKVIDPNQVRKLAALGCKDWDMARFFDISDDSLRYNFNNELILGREDMKITLRTAMLENAVVRMNPAVQIFLAKNILGMKDVPTDNEDNKPLPWDDKF